MSSRIPNRNQQSRSGPGNQKPAERKYRKPVKAIQMVIKLREKAGLTRNVLAEAAYMDTKYYWRLERGIARKPGRIILINLVRTLVSYSKMFAEEDVDAVQHAAGYPPAPRPPDDPGGTFLNRGIRT